MSKRQYKRTPKKDFEREEIKTKGSVKNDDRLEGRYNKRKRNVPSCYDNDPKWYTASSQLAHDAGNFPYSNIQGLPISDAFTEGAANSVCPSIFSVLLWPTIGCNTNDNSRAVNVAARNIYSWIRHANSGHANYDAPDLMKYLLAMDNVYSWYAFLRRIYGVAMLYNQRNRSYPRLLLQSMNVDPDDILRNLAQFRYVINELAVRAGSLCVPSTFSYFTRHIWMYNNVYTDGVTDKAGIYLYNPAAIYYYSEGTEEAGSQLIPIELSVGHHSQLTLGSIIYITNLMMNSIITSEDLGIMSGDILKAYGKEGLITIPAVPDGYVVMPVFNMEVISQIQNSTSQGYPKSGTANIFENMDTGALVLNPTLVTTVNKAGVTLNNLPWDATLVKHNYNFYSRSAKLLSMPVDAPTSDDNFVATRLTNFIQEVESDPDGDGYIGKFSETGSEFIAAYQIFTNASKNILNGHVQVHEFHTVNSIVTTGMSAANITLAMNYLMLLVDRITKFDFHPEVRFDAVSSQDSYSIFDLDNYSAISESAINRIHEVALLNQFSVPLMGAKVSTDL